MPPRALTWLRAHWRPVLAAGAALVLAFASGWAAHRPAPRVEMHQAEAEHTQQQATATTSQVLAQAQTGNSSASAHLEEHKHVTVHRVTHTLPSGERTVTVDRTVDDGVTLVEAQQVVVSLSLQSTILGALATSADTTATRETSVVQTPAAPPSWSLAAVGGLGTRGPLYGGEAAHRVLGPLWLQAGVLVGPGVGVAGVAGVRVEW